MNIIDKYQKYFVIWKKLELGMVAYAHNPSTREMHQEDCHELKPEWANS